MENMNPEPAAPASADPCCVLSLDGGGAKGFYTLGGLKEIEAMAGRPLYQCFDLIFGTSTAARIRGPGAPPQRAGAEARCHGGQYARDHRPGLTRRDQGDSGQPRPAEL